MKESLTRILNRFRHGVDVTEAGPDDLEDCITLAFGACIDGGVAPEGERERRVLIERLGERLTKLIHSTEGCLLLAKRDGVSVGVLYCGLVPAEPWQDKPTVMLWDLYVVPKNRDGGQVALGLMRGGLGKATAWGAGVVCIAVDDSERRAIRRYINTGGFEFVTTQSVLALQIGGK
jgi:hypothetical protein